MFNAIGAHIYAGGFTVGVSKYFNVLAHLEHAAYGKEVVELNFPGLPVHAGGPGSWPKSWPKGSARPRFLYANPPCAIWSGASAGRSTHWKDDPRLQAHHDIFNYGLGLEVDVMAIESVTAAFTKGREHVDGLIEAAAKEGYSATIVLHDARWLGVPQIRKRVFLTFHRVEIPWQTPEPHEAPTVRQALRGLPKKTSGYDTTMPPKSLALALHCGPGGRLKTAFDELYPNPETNHLGKIAGRPSFLESRAPWDKPAGVVIAGKMIHPDQPRYMNQEELAAICSFPPTYKWPKQGFADISGYMSRGVMPKVGEWLAENVYRAIEKGKRTNEQTSTVFDATHLPSSAYPLAAVGSYEAELRAEEPRVHAVKAIEKTALITGSTAIQIGSSNTRLKIMSNLESWKNVLEDDGYTVEWRAVTPGEDLSGYTAVLAALNAPNKVSSSYVQGALWALAVRKDAVVLLDDWQTKEIASGFKTCIRSEERLFWSASKGSADVVAKLAPYKAQLFDVAKTLALGPWPWKVIAPTLGRSDVKLLDVPADVVAIDPTLYAPRYEPTPGVAKKKAWVLASLLDSKAPDGLKWPVAHYGPQDRGANGVGAAGAGAKPRLTESEIMREYSVSWGVVSPPHSHAGSGWWRVRYQMAADAGCVVSADPREAACLGEPYVEASDPRRVEKMSVEQLISLARRQRECLNSIAWPKSRVKKTLRALLERTQPMARNAIAAPAAPRAGSLPPPPTQGEGSGAYMRRLMTSGWNDDQVILTAVHAHFAGSKATKSDVYYNRRKLTTDPKAAPTPSKPVAPPHTGSLKAVVKAAREIAAEQADLPFTPSPPRPSGASDDYVYEQKLGWLFRAAGIIPGDRIKLVALARALGAGGSPSVLTVRVGGKDTTHDVKWLKTLFS